MTFRKNLRYPTTQGGTACGRAGLRYTRKQEAVYAGLRCVRRQCAQAGGCICRLAASASSKIIGHHRRRARRCAGVRTHKFQKPEKRLAAVVPRCAGKCRPRCAIAAVKALCRLTACEIKRYRCRRRAFRWLAEALKEALCRRTAHTNERHPWASKPLRGPAAGESRRYQPSPAMIWTKLRIYERTGDCIRRLGAQTDAALSARLRRTSRREGLRACESRKYRSVVRK